MGAPPLADTKLESARRADGTIVLADEVLTPDSSPVLAAWTGVAAGARAALVRQAVRPRLADLAGLAAGTATRRGRPLLLPPDVVEATRAKYIEAYERITGKKFR